MERRRQDTQLLEVGVGAASAARGETDFPLKRGNETRNSFFRYQE